MEVFHHRLVCLFALVVGFGCAAGGSDGTGGTDTAGEGGGGDGGGGGSEAPGTGGGDQGGSAATGGTEAGGAGGAQAGGTVGNAGAAAGAGGAGGAKTGGSGTGGAGSGGNPGMGGGGGSVFPAGVTRPKIMIVGDSISAGPGCYKKYLAQQLTTNGITNHTFVGEYPDDCGGGVRHSAVSCTNTSNYTQATFTVTNCFGNKSFKGMAQLVAAHNPDLIMLQLGVNDVWGGNSPISPILANYKTLVDQARAHNPRIVVMVAQIHKIITNNCTNTASTTNAQQLVMAVPAWAAGLTTAQSPVLVADLWTTSNAMDAGDCVHPNDAGAQRMGLNWYNALKAILK